MKVFILQKPSYHQAPVAGVAKVSYIRVCSSIAVRTQDMAHSVARDVYSLLDAKAVVVP
jgi:hypothetical protein